MIRIGTRDSKLALWQAIQVKQGLEQKGFSCELVPVKSEGDIDLVTPLYEMGVQGIFTRTLDAALLAGKIDIAVHSMKDVPTQLPAGIVQSAVLARGPVQDVLVYKHGPARFEKTSEPLHIATSSIRRQAQWLHRYPHTTFHNLRGNMATRLQKLESSSWDGAIYAKAGLERIELLPSKHIILDWMLPAPAQGAVMVVCRDGDFKTMEACAVLNDADTATCTMAERDFLRGLMGGCTTPISAYAFINEGTIYFLGSVCSTDGKDLVEIKTSLPVSDAPIVGRQAATQLLAQGGKEIVAKLNGGHHG